MTIRFPSLREKWWKLPLGIWLLIFVLFFAALALFGMFFVRRHVIDYRPEHTFGVNDPAFFGSAHALGDPLPLAGNKIEILNNGAAIFPAMLAAIGSAKMSINFEAYIFYSDAIGRQFRDALCEKASHGVTVRVLLDGLGSGTKLDNSDVKMMKAAGCLFSYFHPAKAWRVDRLNRRTHRRILVVDGALGFTGGVGFAEDWSGNGDGEKHWRDLQAKIEGPLVAKLQGAFQQHWVGATGEALSGPGQFPALKPAGDLHAQLTASHSYSTAPVPLIQATAIAAAEKYIWITNPYCMPTKDQIELLTRATKRGVDVRILVPGPHNDQPMTKSAGRTSYGKLLEGGVKIFEFQPAMIHQKTMIVDGLFTVFGSSNLDARSAQINEELDITVQDENFAAKMEAIFTKDLAQAKPYTLEDFKRRGAWERTTERLASPFTPQL